jgi:hypothetical protein
MPAPTTTPTRQLATFLAKYEPSVATFARAALRRLRLRLPGAIELVYDNYNALAIGFGPNEQASAVIVSIAVYPRWVTLFFLQGARLPDAKRLLCGTGTRVRHIRLETPDQIDEPDVRRLLAAALATAATPIDPMQKRRLVIKSISARQRPRRPEPASPSPRAKPRR